MRGFAESVLIPPIFKALRMVAPRVTVGAVHYSRASLSIGLRSNALDVAIDTAQLLHEDVAVERLGSFDLVAMLPAGRIAPGSRLNIDEYFALDHVVVSTRRAGPGLEDGLLRRTGRTRRVVLRCQNYTTAADVVSDAEVVLTLPRHYAAQLSRGRAVSVCDLFSDETVDYALHWKREESDDLAVAWIRRIVRETCGL